MSRFLPTHLDIELLSDTTFGRGEGTPGEVDVEVEHDDDGLPFLGGKTLRGLLRDSWLSMRMNFPNLQNAAERVFGPTQCFDGRCRLRIGDAHLESAVRDWLLAARRRENDPISPFMILNACTAIRYQTAEDRKTGAPAKETLRSSRVVIRGLRFQAPLFWTDGYEPNDDDRAILAMSALSTRHGGLARNRGRGHLRITLDGNLERTRNCLSLLSQKKEKV